MLMLESLACHGLTIHELACYTMTSNSGASALFYDTMTIDSGAVLVESIRY